MSQGLYGEVSVAHWESRKLPFASDLVNLVVVDRKALRDMDEIMRVLAPLEVACIETNGEWRMKT